jgi:hypothetical protein
MAVLFIDDVIFQTPRPGLATVRWRKKAVVSGALVDITDWSTEGVLEVSPGDYYIPVPINNTDPEVTLIVADTGDGEPFSRTVKALKFEPETLAEINSGGGVLLGRIGTSSLARDKYLEVVQGEEKTITFIVEADGRLDQAVADEIVVRFQDPRKNKVLIPNSFIERVCEELDVQIIRATLSKEDTLVLQSGICRIEISFDSQKAVLKQHLKILEDIDVQEETDIVSDLQVHYGFEEGSGSILVDQSGNGLNGTLFNTPTFSQPGKLGDNYLLFDSTQSEYGTIPLDFNTLSSGFTIASWVRREVPTVNSIIFFWGHQSNGNITLGVDQFGRLDVRIGGASLGTSLIQSGIGALQDGVWHHVACTWNGTTLSLYVDGNLVASDSSMTLVFTSGQMYLGRNTVGNYWNGGIDDFRIYDRALSVDDINVLYELGVS